MTDRDGAPAAHDAPAPPPAGAPPGPVPPPPGPTGQHGQPGVHAPTGAYGPPGYGPPTGAYGPPGGHGPYGQPGASAPPGPYGQPGASAPPGPYAQPGYGPAPQPYAPAPWGYGRPPYGGAVGPALVRHRPGAGLVLGLIGLALLLASLTALPWISSGGEDATFSDIRDALDEAPSSNSVATDYIETYAAGGAWIVMGLAVIAVLFTTWAVPRSKAGRICTGLLVAGLIGVAANAADDKGTFGPRISGTVAAGLCLLMHGYAVNDLFNDDFMPDPAWGAWAGVVGVVLVGVGCLVGTRIERMPSSG